MTMIEATIPLFITCPDSPRELGFDIDTWRPGQQRAINETLRAFIEGKKYVMLAAPTGLGKTYIGAAVQKLLGRAGIGTGRSVALTHTIQLQNQYATILPDARVITGRGNHLCELSEGNIARIGFDDVGKPLTAQDAPCAEGEKCDDGLKTPTGCAYYRQFWEAANAPMVIMNYAYAARILQQDYVGYAADDEGEGGVAIKNPFRRTLLISDECHLAERATVEADSIRLGAYALGRMGLTVPSEYTKVTATEGRKVRQYENMPVWIDWAKEAMPELDKKLSMLKNAVVSMTKAVGGDNSSLNRDRLSKTKRELRGVAGLVDSMRRLSQIEEDAEWLVKREANWKGEFGGVVVQPLWGWTSAPRLLWKHFDRVLLMSATPGDPEVARVSLGIPSEEFEYIELDSPFPIPNRPVFFWDVAKLNYTSDENDWARVADAIAKIATAQQYAGRKGIVHSGSKSNANRLVKLLNARIVGNRFFTHSAAEDSIDFVTGRNLSREEALHEFVETDAPRVLVTASFTTGLDLPYIIGWQVIAKVPYGSLADDITARRRAFVSSDGDKFGQRVYQAEAMNTVIQAAGRIVRAEDDFGPTFITDGNYMLLHRLAYMPRFYKEAFQRLEF